MATTGIVTQLSKYSSSFMKMEGSLSFSQELVTEPYPQPDYSNKLPPCSTLWNYSKCGVYTVESEAGC
jgi:hypothetical protein